MFAFIQDHCMQAVRPVHVRSLAVKMKWQQIDNRRQPESAEYKLGCFRKKKIIVDAMQKNC